MTQTLSHSRAQTGGHSGIQTGSQTGGLGLPVVSRVHVVGCRASIHTVLVRRRICTS